MKKSNLLKLLENKNEQIKLLFIAPNYPDFTIFDEVNTNFFNKNRFLCEVMYIRSSDIDNIIQLSQNYDCIVNLCDNYVGDTNGNPGLDVIEAFDKNKVLYTGSNKKVYCLSKFDMTKARHTPKTYFEKDLDFDNIKFPLFIKPNNLSCSEFIDDNSAVYNSNDLIKQINMIKQHTNDFVIQEYIDGNEYTCVVFRDRFGKVICLDPLEIKLNNFKTNYMTHEIKNNFFDDVEYNYDIPIKEEIKQNCIDVYNDLELDSYVRMDVRNTYIIDVNCYPEIMGHEESENLADCIIQKFYNFDDFLTDILYDACNRNYIDTSN
jgi:hypothetical protein